MALRREQAMPPAATWLPGAIIGAPRAFLPQTAQAGRKLRRGRSVHRHLFSYSSMLQIRNGRSMACVGRFEQRQDSAALIRVEQDAWTRLRGAISSLSARALTVQCVLLSARPYNFVAFLIALQ
jgi:hypothetical protein